MLLGDDFFLSHRVYVANSQRKLYFTYNGGPVFALNARKNAPADSAATAAESAPPLSSEQASSAPPGGDLWRPRSQMLRTCSAARPLLPPGGISTMRRRTSIARWSFHRARPVTLLRQRALVELQLRQPGPAANDIDKAITLNPNYVEAPVMRGLSPIQARYLRRAGRPGRCRSFGAKAVGSTPHAGHALAGARTSSAGHHPDESVDTGPRSGSARRGSVQRAMLGACRARTGLNENAGIA